MKPILIAGIGNIFMGDDAFGCEVARKLEGRYLDQDVVVSDFGIRSYDLAFALVAGLEAAILVDATSRGSPPGSVYLIELDPKKGDEFGEQVADGHSLNPTQALRMAANFGELPRRLYLVGCEPATLECREGWVGLSEPVAAAVPTAMRMIESLLTKLRETENKPTAGLVPA